MPPRRYDPDEGRVQPVIILKEDVDGDYIPVADPVPGGESGVDPVSIKDGADPTRKLTVDASGRVGVNNFPATQPVSGSVAVSNFPATQLVSGTVAVSNPTANPETGLAKEATLLHSRNKFAPALRTTRAFFVNSAGDNAILTPTAGKFLRVHWIGMSSSQDNAAENLVAIRFGAGPELYRWRMGNPGAFSHWEPLDGTVDQPLNVNLANTQGIDVNVTYEEI